MRLSHPSQLLRRVSCARRFNLLTALLAAGLAAAPPFAFAEDAPAPVVLRYLNAPRAGEPLLRPPLLGLSLGGAVHRAVMDTGSTGVVVAASLIPNVDQLPALGPGTLTYTSSGRIMRGIYVQAQVTLHGADGASVRTEPLPVLAVKRVDCLATARRCTPMENPTGIAMLGVGFAREGDRQANGTPEKNPFLHLEEQARRPGLSPGYLVSRDRVEIGLRPATAGDGFTRIKLVPNPAEADWSPIPACYALEERKPPVCGTLLLDTGVTTSYLTVPLAQWDGLAEYDVRGERVLMEGTRLAVLPGGQGQAPAYQFVVGDLEDAVVPERVILVGAESRRPFFNTSVRALNAFDYLYDAEHGEAGFRPVPPMER